MPYARLVQAARIAVERVAEDERDAWRRAAFVGWQAYIIAPSYEKNPRPRKTLDKWLKQFGLEFSGGAPELSKADLIKRAQDAADKVLASFARKSPEKPPES